MIKKKRVLVAMSGGVDSSIAAAILKEEGYEVIGATMKIWPKEYCTSYRQKSCCSLQDIEDARRVSQILNLRHYVFNFEEVFRREVIDYFVSQYLAGRTPNPCIVCNEKIKFGSLLKKAQELGCDFISTGHYARIERNGSFKLKESLDKSKDQAYVLFSLKKSQIQKMLLPIGNLSKIDVRAKARKLGLSVYKKADSQEICFVPEGSYSDFIKSYCGIEARSGKIIDLSGKVLGSHDGFWNFTIGQRKGLGVASKAPLYVMEIDPERNIIVVGDFSKVNKERFIVKDINWFYEVDARLFEAEVKIRYNHKKSAALLRGMEDGKVEVEFKEPQEAITPGQAAVFYAGEYVVGGGWIERVLG